MKTLRGFIVVIALMGFDLALADQNNLPKAKSPYDSLELVLPLKLTWHHSISQGHLHIIYDGVREANKAYRRKIFEIAGISSSAPPVQEDGVNAVSLVAGWGERGANHYSRLTAYWDDEVIYEVDLVLNGDLPLTEKNKKAFKESIKNQLLNLVGMGQ